MYLLTPTSRWDWGAVNCLGALEQTGFAAGNVSQKLSQQGSIAEIKKYSHPRDDLTSHPGLLNLRLLAYVLLVSSCGVSSTARYSAK